MLNTYGKLFVLHNIYYNCISNERKNQRDIHDKLFTIGSLRLLILSTVPTLNPSS